MKRILASLGALAVAILAVTVGYARSSVATAAASDRDITQFQTMIGDHGAFRGTPGAVGGVPAAGLPWVIQAVQGELALDGELKIDVDGLVLADAPSVPASLRGTNPVPFFSAVVSCTTVVDGAITTGNVMTGNFTATPEGNAHIVQRLSLPHPCIAPIVMVTAPDGAAWFAVSGT
jgi:hypothetical protein